jgi:GDP-L-fucose synthase
VKDLLRRLGITAEEVELWGTGTPFREFLHVDDLADALVYLMENHDYASIGEFLNLGTGTDTTIRDIAGMVREIARFEGDIRWDPTKPDGTPRKLLDVSRLNELGWRARTTLREGLERTMEWYISRNR